MSIPPINTGWATNWTTGLVPIKWEVVLNDSGFITERRLIIKCCTRKTNKNNPESAITTFLPIDDFPIPELLINHNFMLEWYFIPFYKFTTQIVYNLNHLFTVEDVLINLAY